MSENVKKSSKVEGSEVKKKPLTKAELMVKFKALEEGNEKLAKENVKYLETITRLENVVEERTETNEKLIKENGKHLDTIRKLESCIKLQRKDTSSNVEHIEVSAQTDDIDEQCNECEYPANDIWELGEHIYEFHTSLCVIFVMNDLEGKVI